MIPVRVSYILFALYVLYITDDMNEISRKQRALHPLLFDPSTKLSTVTGKYSNTLILNDREKEAEVVKFKNFTEKRHFHIDDTEEINKHDNLYCKPTNFGYSIKAGELVFPNFTYPLCTEINTKAEVPELSFDYSLNIFTMSCEEGSPSYIIEPTSRKGRLFTYHELKEILEIVPYKAPVKLTTEEFVFGSCDGKTFNNALHIPRFNQTLYDKTLAKMKELDVHNKKTKPLIVVILTIDSFSRRHFFRKLPKTVEFLNNLSSEYYTFDFKLHNEFGQSSTENMIPVFTDTQFKEIEIPREYDVFNHDSMWRYFSEKGFATLFELEDCDHYFPSAMGRYPEIDSKVRSFYCAAKFAMNFDAEIAAKSTQRCIGNYMSHFYTLNFTYEFSRIYSGINQWIYMHLNPAHEASGQHASTLDLDLLHFLQKFLNEFGKNNEISIFLQADHGMRYGNWYQDLEAYQENKLPAFFLISSKSLIDKIPNAYTNLVQNEFRLTTKKDLRPTINFLADLPYFTEKYNKTSEKFINLFTEIASNTRTCDELGISPFECSCLVVEKIENIEKKPELYELALQVIEEAISKMNFLVSTPVSGDFQICEKISFNEIIGAYGLVLNNKVEELQLKFSINENSNAVFEVFAFIGTHYRSTVLVPTNVKGTVSNYVYRGFKSRIKIFGINRKDKYAGKCEDLTRSLKIKSEYCICKPEAFDYFDKHN